MADRSTSPTLPQNRPNAGESTQSVSSSPRRVSTVIQTGAGTADKPSMEATQTDVLNASTRRGASPAKDSSCSKITKNSIHTAYTFSHDDEKNANWLISKARKVANGDGSGFTNKDIPDLTLMVAQMSYLLAATGFGREKTNRAVAYLNGPDKLKANQALGQAKRDWRLRNRTSSDSSKSKKSNSKQNSKSTANNNADDFVSTKDPVHISGNENISSAPIKVASRRASVVTSTIDATETALRETTKSVAADVDGKATEAEGVDKGKTQITNNKGQKGKPFFRNNWSFKNKYRNRNKKGYDEVKDDVVQDKTTLHPADVAQVNTVASNSKGTVTVKVEELNLSPKSLPVATAAPLA